MHSWENVGPECNSLGLYLALIFVVVMVMTCAQPCALIVTLRSVDPHERPFALGMQFVLLRTLGNLPMVTDHFALSFHNLLSVNCITNDNHAVIPTIYHSEFIFCFFLLILRSERYTVRLSRRAFSEESFYFCKPPSSPQWHHSGPSFLFTSTNMEGRISSYLHPTPHSIVYGNCFLYTKSRFVEELEN
uniref:Uncharacterized protein n=1 Tax=Eptatretus burgeri TaxID=7764 RepID=A0A8C4QWB1_EPTBU